jgi:hypothetical protein
VRELEGSIVVIDFPSQVLYTNTFIGPVVKKETEEQLKDSQCDDSLFCKTLLHFHPLI